MAQYPTLRPSFSVKYDVGDPADPSGTDILAAHVNGLQDEVDAFADVIGYGAGANDPRTPASGGSGGTIHARLQYVESNKAASTHSHTAFGALTLGGAYEVQYDGGTIFQGRRASDNAPWPLYFNWFYGGDIYLGGSTHTHALYADGSIQATQGVETYYIDWHAPGDWGSDYSIRAIPVDADNLHFQGGNVTNEGGYFDGQGLATGDWGTYPIRSTNGVGGGNTGYSFHVPAYGSAAIWKLYALDLALQARAGDDGSYIPIYASSFTNPSSRRWKHDITALDMGLEEVMAMSPSTFEVDEAYIDPTTSETETLYRRKREIGFIAEDMIETVPHVVTTDHEGLPAGIDYARLTAVLVKAVQEQQAQIEELRQRIADLEGPNLIA